MQPQQNNQINLGNQVMYSDFSSLDYEIPQYQPQVVRQPYPVQPVPQQQKQPPQAQQQPIYPQVGSQQQPVQPVQQPQPSSARPSQMQPNFQQPNFQQPSINGQPPSADVSFHPPYPQYQQQQPQAQQQQQPQLTQQQQQQLEQDEKISMLFFILGFVFHIFWIVTAIMYRNHPSPAVSRWGRYSLIAFLVTLALSVLFALFYLGFMGIFVFSFGSNFSKP